MIVFLIRDCSGYAENWLFFFFSSRRRHTRWNCDWSSDVCSSDLTDVNGQPMKEPPYPPLAQGKVRHVGERVAVVIAESLAQARDAAELVEVEYEVLPAVVDAAKAKGAPAIHDAAPD